MNAEIPKLETKLSEMRMELAQIRPLMARNSGPLGRGTTLCQMIAECEKMIANTRASDEAKRVNKQRTS
jgi:hypothetical protein